VPFVGADWWEPVMDRWLEENRDSKSDLNLRTMVFDCLFDRGVLLLGGVAVEVDIVAEDDGVDDG